MYVAFEHSSVNTCPVYGFTFRTRNQEDDPLRWHLDRERAYRQRAQEPRRPAYRAEGPSRRYWIGLCARPADDRYVRPQSSLPGLEESGALPTSRILWSVLRSSSV